MQKYRVAVLRGGASDEYDLSLRTGEHVFEALDRDRYDPLDIVITKSGEWLRDGRIRTPQEMIADVDLVFIALVGAYGEDGAIQRSLDTAHVPYTGSGTFPSAIARNKVLTKDTLAALGMRMPRHMLVSASARANLVGLVEAIGELFGPHYIVKQINGTRSLGARFAENKHMLHAALAAALAEYEQVLVEEFIAGREVTCGVIERFRDQERYAFPPIEILLPSGVRFFDHETRTSGVAQEICPCRFTHEEKREIEELARMAHEALELSQYSRSDFIVADDGVYFLETNTLPNLAQDSQISKALDTVGCSYGEFVNHLVADALGK
jgi:D-alanine-D-alanine ligase